MEFRNNCATETVWKSTSLGWFGGVLSAQKTDRWPVFSEERAGRPWKTLHFKSAAATCAVRGCERPENMPVAYFQRTAGWQAPGRNFYGAELAPRGSQRPENRPVACFQRERAGRPWKKIIHCAFAARESRRDERQRRGGSLKGVLRARKIVLWTIFTEERAGRPWLCPPFVLCIFLVKGPLNLIRNIKNNAHRVKRRIPDVQFSACRLAYRQPECRQECSILLTAFFLMLPVISCSGSLWAGRR